jgi:hypothetical protein
MEARDVAFVPTSDFALAAPGHDDERIHTALHSLPDPAYACAIEFSPRASALTEKLAARCATLGQSDGSAADLTAEWRYDLIVFTDFLDRCDDARAERLCAHALETLSSGGHLVLVHWINNGAGDTAAERMIALAGDALLPITRRRTPLYRVDVFERV